jgi:hypothetical protein
MLKIVFRVPRVVVQSSELGPPSTPTQASVVPPQDPSWQSHTRLRGSGCGGPSADDRTDTLVLYIVIPLRLKVTLSK